MAEATTAATSAETEIHGGSLSVTVDVVNEGDVAYTLSNVALSAYMRSEEHTSELQSRLHLVCRLLLGKKNRTPVTATDRMPSSA